MDRSAKIISGMKIELWRNGKQTITAEEDVKFEVEKVQDANRDSGYREVKQVGVNGKKNVTYEIEMKNGVEVSRKEIASVVTKEPKKQIEIVGAESSFSFWIWFSLDVCGWFLALMIMGMCSSFLRESQLGEQWLLLCNMLFWVRRIWVRFLILCRI
ncbi:G5 domain-containing protein [Candidatus Minimicrobia vallesae]|uniref:G5 domain-containing protein n=1 Tax=Candidatus Minimicrobia vallesae TaxID=2841264 RepID=A0A8F1SAG5_9BACT|nr:G5 domain-containing protein [Candidatus Minimicrobia vallesae]QWQ31258.1 G5 domain-containing protein [Candidatus Minimicrobia vallesae]